MCESQRVKFGVRDWCPKNRFDHQFYYIDEESVSLEESINVSFTAERFKKIGKWSAEWKECQKLQLEGKLIERENESQLLKKEIIVKDAKKERNLHLISILKDLTFLTISFFFNASESKEVHLMPWPKELLARDNQYLESVIDRYVPQHLLLNKVIGSLWNKTVTNEKIATRWFRFWIYDDDRWRKHLRLFLIRPLSMKNTDGSNAFDAKGRRESSLYLKEYKFETLGQWILACMIERKRRSNTISNLNLRIVMQWLEALFIHGVIRRKSIPRDYFGNFEDWAISNSCDACIYNSIYSLVDNWQECGSLRVFDYPYSRFLSADVGPSLDAAKTVIVIGNSHRDCGLTWGNREFTEVRKIGHARIYASKMKMIFESETAKITLTFQTDQEGLLIYSLVRSMFIEARKRFVSGTEGNVIKNFDINTLHYLYSISETSEVLAHNLVLFLRYGIINSAIFDCENVDLSSLQETLLNGLLRTPTSVEWRRTFEDEKAAIEKEYRLARGHY